METCPCGTHPPHRQSKRSNRTDRYASRRSGSISLQSTMGLIVVAVAGLALQVFPVGAVDGGAIANAQPAPGAQPDTTQPAAGSAVPGAPDSLPAMRQPARRSSADANIMNAQFLLASLKETFQAGQVEAHYGDGSSPDSRMEMLCMIVGDKIPYNINKRIADANEREAALAEARKAQEYLDKVLVPAFNRAKESRKPDDAHGLVALMENLDGHLNGLQKVVSAASGAPATARAGPGARQGGVSGAVSSAASSPSGAPVPQAAASEPLDDWTRYVQQFIATHDLNSGQQQLAWSILKELKARAREYQVSHRSEYEALGDVQDKAQRSESLLALNKPLRNMFDELKGRLDGILTQDQRKTASPAEPGRPAGR